MSVPNKWNLRGILVFVMVAVAIYITGCSNNPARAADVNITPVQDQITNQKNDITINSINQIKFNIPSILYNNRALVPLRIVFEDLKAKVSWDRNTSTVTASKGEDTIKLTIGKKIAYKNNVPIELDVPAKDINGKTLVPVSFVSEALGAEVIWNTKTKNVTVINLKDLLASSASSIENFMTWVDAPVNTNKKTSSNEWINNRFKQVEDSRKIIHKQYQLFTESFSNQISSYKRLQIIDDNYKQAIKYMRYYTVVTSINYYYPEGPNKLKYIIQTFQNYKNQ